jgi:hypothetical protein
VFETPNRSSFTFTFVQAHIPGSFYFTGSGDCNFEALAHDPGAYCVGVSEGGSVARRLLTTAALPLCRRGADYDISHLPPECFLPFFGCVYFVIITVFSVGYVVRATRGHPGYAHITS